MQVDADSLGNYLRQERERRHVSLRDISAAIKVQLKFLEALEEDDYDQLPPAPFVVGFLRAYAQCLTLEPDEIVAAYHARYGSSEGLERHRLFVAYQVKPSKHFGWKGVALAVGVMILVAGLAWRILRWGQEVRIGTIPSHVATERTSEETPMRADAVRLASDTRPTQQTASSLPLSQASEVMPSNDEQEQPVAMVSTSESALPLPPGAMSSEVPSEAAPTEGLPTPLVLQAVALEDTWLRVDIDGDQRRALLLTAGKSIQWEATERFVLTVGNAQGTRLMLNGHDVPLPSTRSNVVRDFILTRELVN
jgi:cytoskeleton protein RodZ